MKKSKHLINLAILFTIFVVGISVLNSTAQTFQVDVGNSPPSIDVDPTCWCDDPSNPDDGDGTYEVIEEINYTCYCHVRVTDNNSYQNISSVWGRFYHSTSIWEGSDDNDVHYTDSSCGLAISGGNGSGNDEWYNCSFGDSATLWYWADSGTWTFEARAWDGDPAQNASRTVSQTISDCLNIHEQDILSFGALTPGQTSGDRSYMINNTCNTEVNVSIDGTDLTGCDVGTITANYIHYDESSGTAYGSMCGTMTTSQAWSCGTHNLLIPDPRDDGSGNEYRNTTYWKIQIPTGVFGTCTGSPTWYAEAPV